MVDEILPSDDDGPVLTYEPETGVGQPALHRINGTKVVTIPTRSLPFK